MDITVIKEILRSLSLEAVRYKTLITFVFIVISSTILAVGYLWPQTYETSAVLHVDETNIIEPLLRGRAEVSRVDRINEAREIIYNRQFLESVIADSGVWKDLDKAKTELKVKALRGTIKITKMGREYFRISFPASTQDSSYQILNSTVNLFINYTNKKKKEESFSAYQFIDSQVQSYKKQLEDAEQNLKEFKASNVDGSQGSVSAKISQLRSQIEALELSRSENRSKVSALEKQITTESDYLHARTRLEALESRRRTLVQQLESLRLTYQDNYPDIVSIKGQIDEVDKAIEETYLHEGVNTGRRLKETDNPVYEELRMQLSVAKVELRTQSQRIRSLNKLLEKELVRAEKVAANEATLADLTRDYDVTKNVYEEMLGRKEKARLSMVLDIEGQGVSYEIHEPAVYPLQSIGIKFAHFAIIAPMLGFLIPLGMLVAYIILDPRVRSANQLQNYISKTELLVEIPYCYSMLSKRILRRDAVLLLVSLTLFMAIYVVFVLNKLYGILPALLIK